MAGFKHLDFFLLRTPRLPLSIIHKLNGFDNKEAAWNYVNDLLSESTILDTIYFASKDFYHEILKYIGEEYTPSKDRLLMSLYKYINRMAGRATPYGKFAGVTLGEVVVEPTRFELSGKYIPRYRPDMAYMSYLIRSVSRDKLVQDQLTYYSNNTLSEGYDRYHYIEFTERYDRRSYNWAWVEKNPLLHRVLQFAKEGAKLCELVEDLCQFGVERHRGYQYLYDLIETRLLISELEFAVTQDISYRSLSRLRELNQNLVSMATLELLDQFLRKANGDQITIETYKARKELDQLEQGVNMNLFQVDLLVGASSNQIHKRIIKELSKELEELSVLNNQKPPAELKSFSRRFRERYNEMEVPLMEALDPERGIGYGANPHAFQGDSPLLLGLRAGKEKVTNSEKDRFIQSVIARYYSIDNFQAAPIVLDESDFHFFRSETRNRPQTHPPGLYALGNLLTFDKGVDEGDYLFNLLALGGVSTLPLMTRFAHLDPELKKWLAHCARREESQLKEGVIAEIVCQPESRVGNILIRPSLFKYEIPIIGQSAVEETHRIYLDDLMVSVKDGEISLRSKRLNQRVIPRLSSAHNFHFGMVVYRFLCDLQHQFDTLNIAWDWGTLADAPFTPRVSYKHIILARARWNIRKEVYQTLRKDDIKYSISILKENYNLPDIVSLTNGDNELIIDLRNPLSSEVLLKELKKKDIVLQEFLFDSYQSPVIGTDREKFSNEVVIPFLGGKSLHLTKAEPKPKILLKRTFQPGSEWAYIKIYSGVMECERLLRDQFPRLITDIKDAGIMKKWFFIRYHDPEPHIRMRFLLRRIDGRIPFEQLAELINQHLAVLVENRTIHRLVYDTYDRELERYGPKHMEICESVFHVDSACVLSLLPLFKRKDGKHLRWISGLLGVDRLLTVFGLDMAMKLSLMASLRDAFLVEFSDYDRLKYKIDMKYRENRSWIERFIDFEHEDAHLIDTIITQRTDALQNIIKPLAVLDREPCFELLSSLSHMFINRLFPISQREQEMVIYHFLTKHYISMQKRERSGIFPIQHHLKVQVP